MGLRINKLFEIFFYSYMGAFLSFLTMMSFNKSHAHSPNPFIHKGFIGFYLDLEGVGKRLHAYKNRTHQ